MGDAWWGDARTMALGTALAHEMSGKWPYEAISDWLCTKGGTDMIKKLLLALAGIAFIATAAPVARTDSQLDFTLVNKTGYDIKAVYLSPTNAKDWGANVLKDGLADVSRSTSSSTRKAASVVKWDLMVSWEDEDDPDVYWIGYDLSKINKITLKYDRKADK